MQGIYWKQINQAPLLGLTVLFVKENDLTYVLIHKSKYMQTVFVDLRSVFTGGRR